LSAGGDNQNWVLVPSGAYDQIQNRESVLCLDVSGGVSQKPPVIQSSCATVMSQQWNLVTQSGGVSIIITSSGGHVPVAGGENPLSQGNGAGLVQDVDHKNRANVSKLSPASYRILTNAELATGHGANDPPNSTSRVRSTTRFNGRASAAITPRWPRHGTCAGNHWVTFLEAATDQAETPQVRDGPTDNLISTQQAPDCGSCPSTGYDTGQEDRAISCSSTRTRALVFARFASRAWSPSTKSRWPA
jgi:hypothetical protein